MSKLNIQSIELEKGPVRRIMTIDEALLYGTSRESEINFVYPGNHLYGYALYEEIILNSNAPFDVIPNLKFNNSGKSYE